MQHAPHPVGGAEVDCLGEVEALVEAGVVGAWEGDDELAGALVGLVDAHTLLDQQARVGHGDQVVQQVGLDGEQLGRQLLHHLLELLRLQPRQCVPGLRLAPVAFIRTLPR